MSNCLICTHEALRDLPDDEATLSRVAREVLQGITAPIQAGGTINDLRPRRHGVCLVERCARFIETSCGGCRRQDCQRCSIAAELRAAEDRLNAERDAEIATQSDQVLDDVIHKIADGVCAKHAPFGKALLGEWHAQN